MRKVMLLMLAAVFVFGGCGKAADKKEPAEKAEANERTNKEKKEEIKWWENKRGEYELADLPRELTDLEKEMVKKPGKYSGDQYDDEAALKMLSELPKGLSVEQYRDAILHLVGEDYHQEVNEFMQFDATVEAGKNRPDEQIEEPVAQGVHYAILLDASGSMNAKAGSGTRMDEAKSAIMGFMDILPKESTVSLRVYGHKGTGSDSDKNLSCGSTETLYSGIHDIGKMKSALAGVKPAGWTPIGHALSETRKDIPEDAGSMIVYVVSDGIETCGSDPVAEAEKLAGEGIKPIVNIIGFQVDNEAQQLLKKVAEAGNGEFTYAGSKQDLDKYWKEEYQRLMDAWEQWKNESLKDAEAQKQALMDKAEETGQSIMDKSEEEFKRAQVLQEHLKEKEIIDLKMSGDLWSMLQKRQSDIWWYGMGNKNGKWFEALENGNDEWFRILKEGNNKWFEYYHKK